MLLRVQVGPTILKGVYNFHEDAVGYKKGSIAF